MTLLQIVIFSCCPCIIPGFIAPNVHPALLSSKVQQSKVGHVFHSDSVGGKVHTTRSEDLQTDPFSDIMNAAGRATTDAIKASGVLGSMSDAVVHKFVLNGPSVRVVNYSVLGAVIFLAVGCCVGISLDIHRPRCDSSYNVKDKRPSHFVLSVLVGSYLLLIPGLLCPLFSFLIGAAVMGMNFLISSDNGHPSTITESTFGFIRILLNSGGWIGSLLILLYAIVIPAVKLALLVAAEMTRSSSDPLKLKMARDRIKVVQFISKWACPDMFAYILLLYLFRDLGQRSATLTTLSQLEFGFSCFSLFCVLSTLATVAISPPDVPEESQEASKEPFFLRVLGFENLPFAVALLFFAFVFLLIEGMIRPCMGLRLDPAILYQPTGPIPKSLESIVSTLNLAEQVNTDVSLTRCIAALVSWLELGEVNCFFALFLMVIFMLALVVIDMMLLVWGAFELRWATTDVPETAAACMESSKRTMDLTKALKHCSMLDVAIMGVLVVCCAGSAYKGQGVEFIILPGLFLLMLAEALHYAVYYMVHGAFRDRKSVV